MIKQILIVTVITMANTLTMEITNIHLGYKNIYISDELSVKSSQLTMRHYQLTQHDLTVDKLGFITHQDHLIRVDFNKFFRCYNIEEIDASQPQLNFQFIDRGDVFVKIFPSGRQNNDTTILNQLISFGLGESQLQN